MTYEEHLHEVIREREHTIKVLHGNAGAMERCIWELEARAEAAEKECDRLREELTKIACMANMNHDGNHLQKIARTALEANKLLARAEAAEKERDGAGIWVTRYRDERDAALARAEAAEEKITELQSGINIASSMAKLWNTRAEAAEEKAANAVSTLEAWFDLKKRIEAEIPDILGDVFRTYIRTAENGGMPTEHGDIATAIFDDACRIYLAGALVPVLRSISDDRAEAAEKRVRAIWDWWYGEKRGHATPEEFAAFLEAKP